MHPLVQLMKCAVRIEAKLSKGGIATGSGFAYRFAEQEGGLHIPAIVTNKHVIEDTVEISLPISIADASGNPTGKFEVITYPIGKNNVIHHPDDEVDLCAILAAPIHQYFQNKSEQPALIHINKSLIADASIFSDLLPLEEVTMIGFPNGIWDSTNNGAIARRGVIATIPGDDYLGKKQFVVDMACFLGQVGAQCFSRTLVTTLTRRET